MTTSNQILYAGFDLGTTNSAAAVFDGDRVTLVRNRHGGSLTPSVVRIDGRGRITVGGRARRFLERDPDNTQSEFKRLMGTDKRLSFPAADTTKSPEELAGFVLSAMRDDVYDQLGVAPVRAVISVPALFELPQNSATSEAARLAGFERVELLQEPIASALAAGWDADEGPGTWMVYDIGGGTFDVSLLETRDGLLRVVGHDGDNFLGGRDVDAAIVDWMIERLADNSGVKLTRDNPRHAVALRALKLAAEEAKIELSRSEEAAIGLPEPLAIDGDGGGKEVELDPDLTLSRATLVQLCQPIIDRSLAVCRRLLESKGLQAAQLERIVLVGGPTVMPALRERIAGELGAPIADGLDPMTLVAQGAAIYAATAGLEAAPARAEAANARAHRLWLQYPAVSADLTPHVVGRVMDGGAGARPARIRLVREDGEWTSPDSSIDAEGGFIAITDLAPRRANGFRIEAVDADGKEVIVHPPRLSIVQGITISDPPLSRTVGVALANDHVHVYFERGAALPARRSFTHYTVESVARGSADSVLKIPIVQGEFEQAHLCRLVGTLELSGGEIKDSVPSGTAVEVTIELDRGGRLSATALVPSLEQVFEQVAHLLVPQADPEVLESSLGALRRRIVELRTEAFRNGWTMVLGSLDDAEARLAKVEGDVAASRGGDEDAGQKARRSLIELDAIVGEAELKRRWPELDSKAVHDMAWASDWVSRFGNPSEVRLIEEIAQAVDKARAERNVGELERQLRLARRIGNAAFYRHPSAWEWLFESAASEIDQATDLPWAQQLVREGRTAIESRDTARLRRVVESLWRLLPADVQTRRLSFDSGVR